MKLRNILYTAALIASCQRKDENYQTSADKPADNGDGGAGGAFDCERGAPVRDGSVAHYPVDGDTCKEAANNLREPYAGETECNLKVNYSGSFATAAPADTREKCCTASISGVVNNTYATVLLPHWGGCDPCFDQFYSNLVAHEQGHVDYCNEAGRDLENRVRNIPPKTKCVDINDATTPCDLAWQDVEDEFNTIFDEVSDDLSQKNEKYDNDTNHGETQGATLNCNCDH